MQTTSQNDPTSDDSDRMRNARRAAWARLALETFAHATGLNLDPEGDGPDTAIGDMLTDLRHYVAALGLDFDEINDRSAYRFADEISDQGGDDAPGDDSPTELHALFTIALEQERAAFAPAPEQGAIITELQRQRGFAEDTLKDYEEEAAPEDRDGDDDNMNIECAKASIEAWDEAIKIVTTTLAGPEPTQPM